MEWLKYTIKTTTDAADIVSGILMEVSITDIEIEDRVPLKASDMGKMFIDIPPQMLPDDGISYLSFYLKAKDQKDEEKSLYNTGTEIICTNNNKTNEEILEEIKRLLEEAREYCDIGEGTISMTITADEDWLNNWKKYFKPFLVDNILIKPTWEKVEKKDEDKLIIDIDPGTAFGTGKHETTQLCIGQIKKYVKKGDMVLDVGCGSGILAIIALKLGASKIKGTDIDDEAVKTASQNMLINGIKKEEFELYAGDIISDTKLQNEVGFEKYDVVVANILADIIKPLSLIIDKHMKKDAIFISSGILGTREAEVIEVMKKNEHLEVIDIITQGEWISIVAKKK